MAVAAVGDSVQISFEGRLVRTHAFRHDRANEHGAFANPGGETEDDQCAAWNPTAPVVDPTGAGPSHGYRTLTPR